MGLVERRSGRQPRPERSQPHRGWNGYPARLDWTLALASSARRLSLSNSKMTA
jgi:hypothetical protein